MDCLTFVAGMAVARRLAMVRPWLSGALALATVLSVARAPRAAPERVIERVVAVVDGQPIFASELVVRAAPQERALEATNLPAWRRAPLRRRLLYDVLTALVEERLMERAAKAQGIVVAPDDVDRAMHDIAKAQGWSKSELEVAVVAHGWTIVEYRREVRAQLLTRRLLAAWVSAERKNPQTPEDWDREQKRWIAELRKKSFVELRLPR